MLTAARVARTASAQESLQAIFRTADQFTAGAAQHDDMTLLVMKLE
jgi:sigma-B regulation protein RsbU (phosphoserine phosphatase)